MLPDPVSRTEPSLSAALVQLLVRVQEAGAGAAGSWVAPGWPPSRGRHLRALVPCRCFLSANFRVCLPLPQPPSALSRFSPGSHCSSICTRLSSPCAVCIKETGHFALGDQAWVAGGGGAQAGCWQPSEVIWVIRARTGAPKPLLPVRRVSGLAS